jgi:hypothetical protein
MSRGRVEQHSMSDEEFEIYKEIAVAVYNKITDAPLHLIAPILIKVLISTHMAMKGIGEETPGALQLHDNLQSQLSHTLFDITNQFIRERN